MASADVDITARPFIHDPSAPDPHGPRPGGYAAPPTRDDLDDLFNYDANIGDTFRDVEGNDDAAATSARRRDIARADADLGIDEEIKIKKPRRPIAKLDEERLLSQNGIPKLRRISKERLKFRGKGHEFADVQRLLNTYQLWLDDLFPKAKFADGLALIEKVGHKKRLKIMRQEWINEDKPKPNFDEPSDVDDDNFAMRDANNDTSSADRHKASTPVRDDVQEDHRAGEMEEDGLDDETLYGRPEPQPSGTEEGTAPDAAPEEPEEPEEDELDQLLAEDTMTHAPPNITSGGREDKFEDFADDEEAMAGLW